MNRIVMRFLNHLVFCFASIICICVKAYSIEVPKLTCELMQNPLGITAVKPRLGWQLHSTKPGDKQIAYEIIVSSDPAKAARAEGDVWNSNKIASENSQFIIYDGKSLVPAARYYWKVRVWDANGKPSAWSHIAYWEMAPDFSVASVKWIGAIRNEDSNLPEGRNFHIPELQKKEIAALWNNVDSLAKRSIMLRKSIDINKKISKAIVYISGLGHYQLTINGKKVGASEFAPLWSDYDKTVYYNIYQADSLLESGNNVIGVLLGNGFYNVTGNRYRKLMVSFGPPTLFFQMNIQYEDGSVATVNSDASWKYSESPITFNCIYGGEDYDARLEQPGWNESEFDDKAWKPVVVQKGPKGVLRPQLASPVQVMRQYGIKSIKEPSAGIYVLDMGQNLSGYPTIKVQGKKGQ
jgi:alpha-L-rhamnosidase